MCSAAGKAAAAAAATEAYEAHLDHAVAIGWAYLERLAFEVRAALPIGSEVCSVTQPQQRLLKSRCQGPVSQPD